MTLSPTAPEVRPQSLQQLQAEFLYRYAFSAPGFNILASVLATVAQITVFDDWSLLEWCGGMVLINLARLYVGFSYSRRSVDRNRVSGWLNLYVGGLIVTGAWWGSTAWLLTDSRPEIQFTTLFVVVAVVAGALPMVSVLRWAYITYVSITLGLYTAAYFYVGGPLYVTLGSFIIVFALGLFLISRSQYATYTETIRLRLAEQTNARQDVLTGVPNRRAFEEVFQEEWKRAQRGDYSLSMLFLDVDDFKFYNDYFGHLSGDECLRKIALSLRKALKRDTDFLARFGGEEFVIILPMTDPEEGEAVAERLRGAVSDLHLQHSPDISRKYVSVSIGGASCIPDIYLVRDELLLAADRCLYESKRSGKNQTTWLAVTRFDDKSATKAR